MITRIKTAKEISAMRESGRMLAHVLQLLSSSLSVGMTTKDLANIAAKELKILGGEPAFLNYEGTNYPFPDVLCASINEEVVHGIPKSDKIIQEGDIVSLDFGVRYNGMITDAAISAIAGKPQQSDVHLLEKTKESMLAGIAVLKDNVRVGDIAAAVQAVLDKNHYGIVRELVGHGVGHALHEDPNIPNYGRSGTGPWLKAGMTIAIEPMATKGKHGIAVAEDSWTIITKDGSRSAHFEHTILITENGSEILTEV